MGTRPALHTPKSKASLASTETTTLMISDGSPPSSRMAIGLPLTGTLKTRESTCAIVSWTVSLPNQKAERQVHVVGRDDLRPFLERLGIFAVNVEQENMRLRVHFENAAENERHRTGLAGSRGAEDGEVLAEQLIDLHHRRDRGILLNVADADGALGVAGIGLGKLFVAGAEHHVAERGIARNAAVEF